MKLGADPDLKKAKAAASMPEKEKDAEWRCSSLWTPLFIFLIVCVVLGGFLGAFYMFKDSTQMHKDHIMTFLMSSREKQDKIINSNIRQQNTLTEEEKTDRPTIYHDFEKGLSVLVDKHRNTCLLYPPNPEELEEKVHLEYLVTHPNSDGSKNAGAELTPHEEEIEDRNFVGPAISALCENKPIIWLYPRQTENDAEGDEALTRHKRSTYGYYYRYYCCRHGGYDCHYSSHPCRSHGHGGHHGSRFSSRSRRSGHRSGHRSWRRSGSGHRRGGSRRRH